MVGSVCPSVWPVTASPTVERTSFPTLTRLASRWALADWLGVNWVWHWYLDPLVLSPPQPGLLHPAGHHDAPLHVLLRQDPHPVVRQVFHGGDAVPLSEILLQVLLPVRWKFQPSLGPPTAHLWRESETHQPGPPAETSRPSALQRVLQGSLSSLPLSAGPEIFPASREQHSSSSLHQLWGRQHQTGHNTQRLTDRKNNFVFNFLYQEPEEKTVIHISENCWCFPGGDCRGQLSRGAGSGDPGRARPPVWPAQPPQQWTQQDQSGQDTGGGQKYKCTFYIYDNLDICVKIMWADLRFGFIR